MSPTRLARTARRPALLCGPTGCDILRLAMPRSDSEDRQRDVGEDFDGFCDTYTEQIRQAVRFSGLEREFFITVKRDCLLRLAAAHFGATQDVDALDLGCGIGAYHAGLTGAFRTLSAVDVSQASVERARAQYPSVAYAHYDGGHLPYDDGRFDLVFAICVIHHVPQQNWDSFAAEMFRVTRPGGLAVVLEHNPLNPATQYIVRSCPIDEKAVLVSPRATARLLAAAGFQIGSRRSILSVPPVGRFTTAVDRALGWLPFGAQYFVTGIK